MSDPVILNGMIAWQEWIDDNWEIMVRHPELGTQRITYNTTADILPQLGSLFSRSDAYRYLPESVDFFPTRQDIIKKIIHSGFQQSEIHDLTFGISNL